MRKKEVAVLNKYACKLVLKEVDLPKLLFQNYSLILQDNKAVSNDCTKKN